MNSGTPVQLHLTVTDTGPDIAPPDRERVFQPFAQADSTATRKHGGAGLGLSITHRLIGLIGGSIWRERVCEEDCQNAARSAAEVGTGTTFHVVLDLPAADPSQLAIGGLETDVPKTLAPKLRGLPVLIADASAANRRLLCEALESWQMAPVSAASEEEARDLVAAAAKAGRAFPLVLADAPLAGLPGSSSAGRPSDGTADRSPSLVAEAAAAGGAGVVLVTADGRRRRRSELDAPGVAGAVEKPIGRSELLDAIVAALGAEPIHEPEGDKPRAVVPTSRQSRLRVLLVEDTAANRKVISAVLKKRGHHVTLAVNGRAGIDTFARALDAAAERPSVNGAGANDPDAEFGAEKAAAGFDAVLMDVQMPVMDGLRAV
ncbi:MAG: ATP-binding protein, partial [Planctomycetota bacterium]